jgi:hypothetical protein
MRPLHEVDINIVFCSQFAVISIPQSTNAIKIILLNLVLRSLEVLRFT